LQIPSISAIEKGKAPTIVEAEKQGNYHQGSSASLLWPSNKNENH
jgi:hypothetical protein